jgi:all-trans-retinol 13,14-reductase
MFRHLGMHTDCRYIKGGLSLNQQYDVIIIGSGVAGLSAALELAAQNKKVLVLEQHYLFGGACTTYSRKGGFKFDAGVESISGLGKNGPVRHFLQRHGLMDEICWLPTSYEFRFDQQIYEIPHNFMEWRNKLIRDFPHEAKGLHTWFEICKAAFEEKYQAFAPARITPNTPVTPEEQKEYAMRHPHYFRWMNSTWGEFLFAHFKDPILIQQLSMLTNYIGDRDLETSAASMFSIMGYFIEGGFRPQGGSGELTAHLV